MNFNNYQRILASLLVFMIVYVSFFNNDLSTLDFLMIGVLLPTITFGLILNGFLWRQRHPFLMIVLISLNEGLTQFLWLNSLSLSHLNLKPFEVADIYARQFSSKVSIDHVSFNFSDFLLTVTFFSIINLLNFCLYRLYKVLSRAYKRQTVK